MIVCGGGIGVKETLRSAQKRLLRGGSSRRSRVKESAVKRISNCKESHIFATESSFRLCLRQIHLPLGGRLRCCAKGANVALRAKRTVETPVPTEKTFALCKVRSENVGTGLRTVRPCARRRTFAHRATSFACHARNIICAKHNIICQRQHHLCEAQHLLCSLS